MSSHRFDQAPDRETAGATKWLGRADKFGHDDVLPMWVADMEFATAPAIQAALSARASHPSYGYTEAEAAAVSAFVGWLARRHQSQVDDADVAIADALLPCVSSALLSCSQPDQGVVVMPPLYPPLLAMPQRCGRRTIECPLLRAAHGYQIDWDRFEQLIRGDDITAVLWCSPHNPVGRVWTEAECQRLLALARQNNVAIISDEAHADLVTEPGAQHHMLAWLAEPTDTVVSIFTPGKTFNTQGLGMAGLVSRNHGWLARVQKHVQQHCPVPHNPFSLTAFQAGYEHGDDWLDALLQQLAANRALVAERLAGTAIAPVPAQATYLAWLDARALGLKPDALAAFFLDEAGLGLNPGSEFGHGGEGYMRMNIAMPHAMLSTALDQLLAALQRRDAS